MHALTYVATSNIDSPTLYLISNMTQQNQHYHTARTLWTDLTSFTPGQKVTVTGKGLDISTVVAVSR